MSRGFSQGINSAPFIPSSNSPFAVGAADNGLSVDTVTGKIVLGQDIGDPLNPGILLSPREIPLAGNDLNINNAIDSGLGVPAQQGNVFVNLLFSPPGASYNFTVRGAQNDGVTNALEFTITKHTMQLTDDVNGTPINILTADNLSLSSDNGLSLAPPIYKIGDVNNVGNSSLFEINDTTGVISLLNAVATFFQTDLTNQKITWGDVNSTINNTLAIVDVPNKVLNFQAANNGLATSNVQLQADDTINTVFASIAVFQNPATSMQILLDASNNKYSVADAVNMGMLFDYTTKQFQMGDITGFANGNRFIVDETNSLFIFENIALNSAIQINGVTGFTGTVAPVNTITVVGGIVTNVA